MRTLFNKDQGRRESILDAFDQLVERYGAEKVRVQEVADEVGVSVGTLYNDFGNKEGLFDCAAERLRTSVLTLPEEQLPKQSLAAIHPPDELRVLVLGWIRALMELSFSRRLFLYRSLAPGKRGFPQRFQAGRDAFRMRLAGRIALVLQRGVDERFFHVNDPIETADRIVDAFSEYWLPLGLADRQPDEVMRNAESLLAIVQRGIAAQPPG